MRLRAICAVMSLVAVASSSALLGAQSDVDKYRVEYAAYTAAHEEKDSAKKAKAFLDFLKQFPKSKLVANVVPEYQQLMLKAHQAGKRSEVMKLADDLLAFRPTDTASLYLGANSALQSQNYPRTISYAERLYKAKATDAATKNQAAYMIAAAAVQTNDKKRVIKYGEQACARQKPEQCFAIYSELMTEYFSKGQLSKASQAANNALKGLRAVRNQRNTREWRGYVDGHTMTANLILAHTDYRTQKWKSAIRRFKTVLSSAKKNGQRAEAYYHMGMGFWKQNVIDPAMENFAKGSRLGGQYAKSCTRHLEDLYRSTHNGSTAGLDEYIARVANE